MDDMNIMDLLDIMDCMNIMDMDMDNPIQSNPIQSSPSALSSYDHHHIMDQSPSYPSPSHGQQSSSLYGPWSLCGEYGFGGYGWYEFGWFGVGGFGVGGYGFGGHGLGVGCGSRVAG